VGDLSRRQRDTLYPQKLALTSPTSGCRSVGIDRSRTQATEFFVLFLYICGEADFICINLYKNEHKRITFVVIISTERVVILNNCLFQKES
jgi:hypothetical protein